VVCSNKCVFKQCLWEKSLPQWGQTCGRSPGGEKIDRQMEVGEKIGDFWGFKEWLKLPRRVETKGEATRSYSEPPKPSQALSNP
jgi:hypothetical protein